MTEDRRRLILSCVHWDQFIFLIAEDDPMRCPRMDHFGFAVGSLDRAAGRARPRGQAFARTTSRVDLIDLHVDDQKRGQDPLALREVPATHDVRGPVVGVRLVTSGPRVARGRRLRSPGLEARVHRLVGHATAWARSVELARLAEELGYDHLWVYDHVETVPRTRADPLLRGVHDAGGAVAAAPRPRGWVSSSPARPIATQACWPRRLLASTSSRAAGSSSDSGPAGSTRSTGLRLRVSGRPGTLGGARRDDGGHPPALVGGDGHLRRRAPALRRCLLRPEARPGVRRPCWWAAAESRSTSASPPGTPT